MGLLVSLGLLITMTACREASQPIGQGRATNGSGTHPRAVSVNADGDSLDRLIGSLRELKGQFRQESGEWFSPEIQAVFPAMSSFRDSTVTRLTECLSDTAMAKVTLAGAPVRLAVVCGYVLRNVAYYEAFDDRPHGPEKYKPWPGDVSVTASPEEYRVAQRAWQEVIRKKAYHLL